MTRQGQIRLLLLGIVLLLFAGAYVGGVFDRFSDPGALAQSVVELGAWGYLAFLIAYTVLQPFGVPGTIFIVAAPLIWPWETAFALSMAGTMAASVVGFSFARFMAREWVSRRIPVRLRKYEAAMSRSALRTVFVLRLIFWMPQPLHFFLGVSRVSFWTHFWGSVLGYLPPLFLVSYLGAKMFDASGSLQPDAWPILGGLLVLSVLVALVARIMDRRTCGTDQGGLTRDAGAA